MEIDDDFTVRRLARATLEQAGFRVEEATDGVAGVAAFERLRPDIVLLDVMSSSPHHQRQRHHFITPSADLNGVPLPGARLSAAMRPTACSGEG